MIRIGFVKARLSGEPPERGPAFAYACAMIVTPTLIRASLDSYVSDTTFGAYYPFILISALLLSWRNAAAVTICSAILANFLFMEPRYVIFASATDTIGTFFFILCSLLIVAVGQTLRRAVHELEAARTREAHLNRELQHRVKNTLAVVQGLVVQTFRDIPDANSSVDKLHGRIRALADANEILRDGRWEECRLPALAVKGLEPFNARGAITLFGPECSLPEESCVPLVLALHELATNAVKYGALSNAAGSVQLIWETAKGTEDGLKMEWRERGGPPVCEPTRRGLGSKLLRPQLGLSGVALSFEPVGVSCTLCLGGVRELPPAERDRSSLPPVTLYSAAQPAAACQLGLSALGGKRTLEASAPFQ